MAKISNKERYENQDPIYSEDYFPITDYKTKKTKTVQIGKLSVTPIPPEPTDPSLPDKIISGNITWLSGLTYINTDMVIRLAGVNYDLPAQTITLPDADITDDRRDIVTARLNLLGTPQFLELKSIQGNPSPNPLKPIVLYPETEFELTNAYIPANATQPDGVSIVNIYDENAGEPVEWSVATNSIYAIDLESTENPYLNSKSTKINFDNILSTDVITGSSAIKEKILDLTFLNLSILLTDITIGSDPNLKTSVPNKYIVFKLMNGGVQVGTDVRIQHNKYGLNTTILEVYQHLIIPIEDFNLDVTIGPISGITEIDSFEISFQDKLANVVFLDDIKFVKENSAETGECCNPLILDDCKGVISLTRTAGILANSETPSTRDLFNVEGLVQGSWQKTLINNNSQEPNINGAVKVYGNDFVIGENIYLITLHNGFRAEYRYQRITV
ncbi:MAG: hypothetical protein QM499_01015 [Flavobacteriaceae bacterium]